MLPYFGFADRRPTRKQARSEANRRKQTRRLGRVETLEPRQLLTSFYVDADNGNDLQTVGSFEQPFSTIGRAAVFAQAGDTVFIREGIYREQVSTLRSGTESAPIRFQPYQDEQVVISGGEQLSAAWSPAPEVGANIWKIAAPSDAGGNARNNTLFVDGMMQLEASHFADEDRLDTDSWGNIGVFPDFGNTMQSNDLKGFGNDYWNGATILMQTRDYSFATRTIVDYDSASGTVTLDTNVDDILQRQTNHFRIYGTLKALDKPGEWIKQGGTLYYQAEAGQNPNTLDFEWKERAFGFRLENHQHIHIDGIKFRGVSIDTLNANHSVFSNNEFYAYDRGTFGRFEINGNELVIRDNTFSYSWHEALHLGSTIRTDIVNNYFHDFALEPPARGLQATNASELLISHNTFRKFGRSIFDGYPVRSEIAYNLFEDAGKTSSDTGVFDSDGGNGNNSYSIVHHNVFRDSVPSGVVNAFYGRNANIVIHHNIIYDWEAKLQGNPRELVSALKPDFKYFYHNTVVNSRFSAAPVGIEREGYNPPESQIEGNWNNNLQSSLENVETLGADTRGTLVYTESDFVDYDARDFRLAAGSPAIDAGVVLPGINDNYTGAAPDAGALEFGESMWHVGHDFANQPNPTYDWVPLPGTNLYPDGVILDGLDGWQVTTGTPNSTDRNSWNLKEASFTGTFRTQSIEFEPGDSITRSFTGLKPNTLYTAGGAVRVGELVATGGNYSSSSGGVTTGTYRDTFYVAGLTDSPNSWVQYDNIDFGQAGQFDTLEIVAGKVDLATVAGSGAGVVPVIDTSVEVWLDGPNGQLLGTLQYHDLYQEYVLMGSLERLELPSNLQGSHSIALRVNGANASNVAIGEIRLFQSNLPEADKLTLAVHPAGGVAVDRQLGWMDWQPGYETLSFVTGNDGSAQVYFANTGRFSAYLDRMFLLEGEVRVGDNVAYVVDNGQQSTTAAAASLAVDGDLSTFSDTQDVGNSWWQTDLGGQLAIGEIVLHNRADARYTDLSDFTVSVWDKDPAEGGSKLWEQSYFATGSVDQGGSLRIDGDAIGADGVTRLGSAFGRVVRVQLNGQNNAGNGRLSLAEVEIRTASDAPPARNVAQGKPTQATRTYYGTPGAPENGNNGAVDTRADYASQITALPQDGGGVWWQVDLENTTDIDQIVIINNRDDAWRMGAFRVSVWDDDPTTGGQEIWGKNYNYSSSAPAVSTTNIGDGTSLRIDGDTLGSTGTPLSTVSGAQFVRVQYIGSVAAPHNVMTLAEVQVWAPDTKLEVIVDPTTGRSVMRNISDVPVMFDGYALRDTSPSLLPNEWLSLQDQSYDAGIWFEAAPNPTSLVELTIQSATTLMPGQSIYLGELVDPSIATNLTFEHFYSSTSLLSPGSIRFGDPGVPTLPGDYNNDHTVDTADFTVWRDALGETVVSFTAADGNGDGRVDASDYHVWLSSYGTSQPALTMATGTASPQQAGTTLAEPTAVAGLELSPAALDGAIADYLDFASDDLGSSIRQFESELADANDDRYAEELLLLDSQRLPVAGQACNEREVLETAFANETTQEATELKELRHRW